MLASFISSFIALIPVTIAQSLILSFVVLAIMIPFRILSFPDLTSEGAYPLGGCVCALGMIAGLNPFLAALVAMGAGFLAGFCTAFIHLRFRIHSLLAGILMMIGLYSINLRVMGGKAMLSLLRLDTIYTDVAKVAPSDWAVLSLGLMVAAAAAYLLYVFLQTEMGLALRATGDNEQMSRSMGVNTDSSKVLGLALGNGLVALSGAMVAQYQAYSDVGMGIGMIVVGLASVIMGEVVFGNRTLARTLAAVLIGSIVYREVIAAVMRMGLPTSDLKLFSALLVIAAMASPMITEKLKPGKTVERMT